MSFSWTATLCLSGEHKLQHPFNMIICGPSGAGKTSFIHRILKNIDSICNVPFSRVVYAYGIFQPLYRDIAKIPNVQMVEGMPSVDDLQLNPEGTLLVLDDLFLDTSKETAQLFTRLRHLNLSTIFVTHNFFHECRFMRTITRNAHYLVFFRNPRDAQQLAHLSRQMYPGKGGFLQDAMRQVTCRRPYGYLFLDLKPGTPDSLRVCTGIFADEEHIVFCPADPINIVLVK
jgi:hypothetical protein